MSFRHKKRCHQITTVLGCALLLVALAGLIPGIGAYKDIPPREWERFDDKLVHDTPSLHALIGVAHTRITNQQATNGAEKMRILTELVAQRFTHGEARHSLLSNWPLFILGYVQPRLAHIMSPSLLVANGHSLFCDQSSFVLITLAEAQEIRCRHVGLNGHVVMEAWYDDDWHLYDPDLEIIPADTSGRVLSVDELALRPRLLQEYYGPHGAVDLLASRVDNSYPSLPVGSRFDWRHTVWVYVEMAMQVVKFVLPVGLIIIGLRDKPIRGGDHLTSPAPLT